MIIIKIIIVYTNPPSNKFMEIPLKKYGTAELERLNYWTK